MNITKIGHCALLVEVNGLRLVTDPGNWSPEVTALRNIDAILITHEHADHCHVPAVQELLVHSPHAQVVGNASVTKLLGDQHIPCLKIEAHGSKSIANIRMTAFPAPHEEIYEEFGSVENTGFLINQELYVPGDSFALPGVPVTALALPVAGPWCSIASAVRFALAVQPKVAFPVHDGMLIAERVGGAHAVPKAVLAEAGITFVALRNGETLTV